MPFASPKLLSITLATLGVAALAQAADLVKPNIKPGLWEVSNHPQVSGQLPISDEQLAKLTPEQRARMQAAMQSVTANNSKPHVYKECMTAEKIARGFDLAREDSACTRKVVSSSSHELTLHDECNKQDGKTVSDVHFEVKDGTQMNGKVNVVMTSGSKTMTMNSTIAGKWLAASCGPIKDIESEK
jgi:uncharacterized protein DUF3617